MNARRLLRSFNGLHRLFQRGYKGASSAPSSSYVIDLRSDTVTKPSPEMRHAMMAAEVGDDVYKEDPSVNKLEEFCADLFGKESALFVPSGTMGNLLCLMSHCNGRGEELIIGSKQHVYIYEQGHFMQLASIGARVIPNNADGSMDLTELADNINDGSDFHCSKTKLICLENTHMKAGGIPLSLEYLKQVGILAKNHNIAVHVDGARLYNAAVSLDCDVSELLVDVDSVSMCLSKGIGAPVGSVIGGSKDLIDQAKRLRKALGGGMRQAGVLAAAGLYALERARMNLHEDHQKARTLALGLKEINTPDIIDINLEKVQSNLLFCTTKHGLAPTISNMLRENGILCTAFDDSTLRIVTHLDISDDDVTVVLRAFQHVIDKLDGTPGLSRFSN